MKHTMTEKNMLDLIKHYYPDTYIEDDKYLVHTRCNMWDKKQDIIQSLKKYKNVHPDHEILSDVDEIPINELYQFYCKGKNKFITSKRYFERFIKEEYELYIVEDSFIKVQSFDNM